MFSYPWIVGYNRPFGTTSRNLLELTPFRLCVSNSSEVVTSCTAWTVRSGMTQILQCIFMKRIFSQELSGNSTCCGFQATLSKVGFLCGFGALGSAAAAMCAVFRVRKIHCLLAYTINVLLMVFFADGMWHAIACSHWHDSHAWSRPTRRAVYLPSTNECSEQ